MSQGQAAAILHELREIRRLLENQQGGVPRAQAAPRSQRAEVSVVGGHVIGHEGAPLTLVEFTDYQCPFCSQFAATTFDQLKKTYIDTGRLRLVSRDLPLAIHQDAERAAYAARCAGERGKYWEMRNVLFRNNTRLGQAALIGYAERVGLDRAAFEACLTSDRYAARVRQDVADAGAIGITGTPGFVLGRSRGDLVEGVIIVGAQPFGTFEAQIKALLADGS